MNIDEIRKRWGDAEKGSQYYADIHELIDEVDKMNDIKKMLEGIAKGLEAENDKLKARLVQEGLSPLEAAVPDLDRAEINTALAELEAEGRIRRPKEDLE